MPAGALATGSCWPRLESRRSTATCSTSIGRCVERHPELEYVLLLEPYSYGLAGKLAYLVRLVRGMYHLQTARLFVDRQRLPAGPRRPAPGGDHGRPGLARRRRPQALRAGHRRPRSAEPERTFLHRYYDAVVVGGEWTRGPYSAALRTPIERVLALGSPRTDFFFDEAALAAARARVLAAHPELAGPAGRPLRADVPGPRRGKRAAPGLDAPRLRAALPPDHALVLKTHPNLDPDATATAGYDVVADPTARHQRPAGADRHPHHRLLVLDRGVRPARAGRSSCSSATWPTYEVDPGLYLDYRTEMIGTQVIDTDGIIDAIANGTVRPVRLRRRSSSASSVRRDGGASARFVDHFLEGAAGRPIGEVLPFRPMSATSEVPAAFRHAAGDRGPARAHPRGASRTSRRDVGWSATSSRPTSASAARTPSSATSGGCSTRSSRWSSTSSS